MATQVAFIADGQLMRLSGASAEPTLMPSDFANQLLERRSRERQNKGWQGDNPLWGSMQGAGGLGPMLAGMGAGEMDGSRPVTWLSLAAEPDGSGLLYVLQAERLRGLFRHDFKFDDETRLVHRPDFQAHDLARRTGDGRIACNIEFEDGSSNLAIAEADARKRRLVTEGDSRDESPHWVGTSNTLIYQSTGLSRTAEGWVGRLSPVRIEHLDAESGEHGVVIEDDAFDYLRPQIVGEDESRKLLCIRRPYDPDGTRQRPPVTTIAKDAALLPVRLARAGFAFLDSFSRFFTNQPLMTSGGPKRQGRDARTLMIRGRLVQVERARQAEASATPLVPKDWQLVSWALDETLNTRREPEVLADHVVDFQPVVGASDEVVFTDGRKVMRRSASGDIETLCRGRYISAVAAWQRCGSESTDG